MKLDKDDIKIIEVELTGYCNLRCPLCLYTNKKHSNLFTKKTRDITSLIKQLDEYKNLERITIAGMVSEPTLYPNLFELLTYFKRRNIIVHLYTNGNTHNEEWWKELGKYLSRNDECIFTICGSTQDLHEKYRVGSSLQQILENANSFRNENKNDRVVFIKFEYNKHDVPNLNAIFSQFSKTTIINSQTYNEQLETLSSSEKICLDKKLETLYRFYRKKIQKKDKFDLDCQSFRDRSIVIDNLGRVYPCNYSRLKEYDFNLDYSDIFGHKHMFCCECDSDMVEMMGKYNIEGFNGNG